MQGTDGELLDTETGGIHTEDMDGMVTHGTMAGTAILGITDGDGTVDTVLLLTITTTMVGTEAMATTEVGMETTGTEVD